MNSAHSIDFLHTQTLNQPMRTDWRKLAKLPFGQRLVKPIASRQAMYGENGGFVFEHQPAITFRSGVATGLIGTFLFGLVGSAIALGTVNPSSLVLPVQTSTMDTSALTSRSTSMASTQPRISVQEEPVSPKITIPPTKSIATTSPAPEPTAVPSKLNKSVFGFLPYWFVDSAKGNINYSLLSTLAYFDIGVLADGSFDKNAPGWQKLSSSTTQDMFDQARKANTRVVLTFTSFDDGAIESVVLDSASGERAIDNMIALAKQQKAGGANIDFEYVGATTPGLRSAFTNFVQRASDRFHKEIPGSEVTVSTYAASAKWQKLYEVAPLAQSSDGLFIMGYDFSTVNSARVGPVAPLTGAPNTYWYDITSAVEDFLADGVPADKMILGVPYYGYDWPTSGQAPKSIVVPGRTNTANYSAVKKAIEKGIGTRKWDYEAQVPYFTYVENGTDRVAYYEDVKSLGLKYDLINNKGLKGAGIWALGQEGSNQELWDLIEEKFGNDN